MGVSRAPAKLNISSSGRAASAVRMHPFALARRSPKRYSPYASVAKTLFPRENRLALFQEGLAAFDMILACHRRLGAHCDQRHIAFGRVLEQFVHGGLGAEYRQGRVIGDSL